MPKRYFALNDDMTLPDRWLLGTPVDADGSQVKSRPFMSGEPTHVEGRLCVPISHPGTPLDFSLVDEGGFPIVTQKVAQVFTEMAADDIQFFPVQVDTRSEAYFLLNVTRLVKCIDDAASTEVRYWKPEDERPEKTGQYRAVYDMRIDPSQV